MINGLYLIVMSLVLSFCVIDDNKGSIISSDPIEKISVGDHRLEVGTYGSGNYTIVLESGLGSTLQSKWQNSKILQELKEDHQVIIYNRAGYGGSDRGPLPRTLIHSTDDLYSVISQKSSNFKVILVGHSWGGTVARAFAVRFPDKLDGIILLDPWHEDVFNLTQQFIDQYLLGAHEQGAKDEVENALATIEYLRQLGDIPDMPAYILTAENAPDFSQYKIDIHESLGDSISAGNFHHELVPTGHDIPVEDPDLVIKKIRALIDAL